MEQNIEIWKDILEYEYQVSTHGRVRSKDRIVIRTNGKA